MPWVSLGGQQTFPGPSVNSSSCPRVNSYIPFWFLFGFVLAVEWVLLPIIKTLAIEEKGRNRRAELLYRKIILSFCQNRRRHCRVGRGGTEQRGHGALCCMWLTSILRLLMFLKRRLLSLQDTIWLATFCIRDLPLLC